METHTHSLSLSKNGKWRAEGAARCLWVCRVLEAGGGVRVGERAATCLCGQGQRASLVVVTPLSPLLAARRQDVAEGKHNTTHTYTHDTPWQSQAGPFPPTRSQRLPYQVLALGTAGLSFHPVRGIGGTHSAGVGLVLGPAASTMCLSFLSSGYWVAAHRWAPFSDSFGFLPCVSWRSPGNPAHLPLDNLLCQNS